MALFPLGGKADPGDVIIIEISMEPDPMEIPRSSTHVIDCCYLVSSDLMEIRFNASFGSVDVEVSDQSSAIVGSGQLLATPGTLYVPVNSGNGLHAVYIETSSGDCYSGCFIL